MKPAIALVLLVVILIGCKHSSRSSSSPSVTYEVTGTTDSASVTYENETGGTEQADVTVPWTKRFVSHGGFLYLSAQNRSEYGSITVRINIDGQTVKTSTSNGGYTIASASYNCCP
ncbi:MAG TPA: hypothetical protein VIX17_11365 [Pyrinomonadaceae bacterium]